MATWTAPSLFSTSAWNGPGGSPIISPSRWDALVLANACVLAVHDHSGSAGEGIAFAASLFPAIDNDQFSPFFPTASTNWSRENRTTWLLMGCVSTSTNGDAISYDVYLRDGTYQLDFLSGCGSAMGIVVACLNGTCMTGASWDCYKSGAETANVGASVSFTASGYGERQLTFAVNGSQVNSTGYIARLNMMSVRRTGA